MKNELSAEPVSKKVVTALTVGAVLVIGIFVYKNILQPNPHKSFQKKLGLYLSTNIANELKCKRKRRVQSTMNQFILGFGLFNKIQKAKPNELPMMKTKICQQIASITTSLIAPNADNHHNWECVYKRSPKLKEILYKTCKNEFKTVVVKFL